MTEQVNTAPGWERDVVEKALLTSVEEHRRTRRWGIFFKLIIVGYILLMTIYWFQGKPKQVLKDHVALIDLMGTIGQGNEVEADQVASSLRRAFEEPKVKAVILRINSPGGTPVQSAYIYDEVMRLRKKHNKKVYAVVVDICASGAYYVAAGADEIYANASSIVGSIGVIMPGYGFVDVMKKVGVEQRSLAAGKNKMFMDPFKPENPEQIRYAQALIDNVHKHFINAVKAGRGDKIKGNPEEIYSGLFWTGEKALELGLIDGLGSAGFVAREVIKIDEIIDYSATHSLLDRLANKMGASMSKQLSSELGLNNRTLR